MREQLFRRYYYDCIHNLTNYCLGTIGDCGYRFNYRWSRILCSIRRFDSMRVYYRNDLEMVDQKEIRWGVPNKDSLSFREIYMLLYENTKEVFNHEN